MREPKWETFFRDNIIQVLRPDARVLDIGAGLRVDPQRGNTTDPKRAWIRPYLEKVTYQVMDLVDTYNPHIVGDIMKMPIHDERYDAILCLAVLEHIPRPWDAVREMFRVLKKGGRVFCYVPFLSPYHAMPGYYGDYFRYSEEGTKSLFADFEDVQVQYVRGPLETLFHLTPRFLGKFFIQEKLARRIDTYRNSPNTQVSGYYFSAHRP